MITNIIDRRTHAHRWLAVDAVAEATWHDNSAPGTPEHDNADPTSGDTFEWRTGLSVAEAVVWAQTFSDEVTLYLYDPGSWEGRSDQPSR